MKYLIRCFTIALFLLSAFTPRLNAAILPVATFGDSTMTMKAATADQLIFRLEEIKSMDKSGLNFSEKRQLRKEVRAIKSNLNNNYNGVYISVGSLIIIILLLILIL